MAEFCLECWNKMNEGDDIVKKYILSKHLDLCEGCGEWKNVIIMERKAYHIQKIRRFILPISIIYNAMHFIWRIMIFPYLKFKYNKSKNKQK